MSADVEPGFSGGTGSAFAVVPAQNATGNWIKVVQRLPVRVKLDPKELAAHPLRVTDVAMLADRLFGTMDDVALRRHLREHDEHADGWPANVQAGNFAAIPTDL